MGPGGVATITVENGRLFVQPPGQPKEELFPESETTFFLAVPGVPGVTFAKDAEGKVTELILRQGTQERKAKKVK